MKYGLVANRRQRRRRPERGRKLHLLLPECLHSHRRRRGCSGHGPTIKPTTTQFNLLETINLIHTQVTPSRSPPFSLYNYVKISYIRNNKSFIATVCSATATGVSYKLRKQVDVLWQMLIVGGMTFGLL